MNTRLRGSLVAALIGLAVGLLLGHATEPGAYDWRLEQLNILLGSEYREDPNPSMVVVGLDDESPPPGVTFDWETHASTVLDLAGHGAKGVLLAFDFTRSEAGADRLAAALRNTGIAYTGHRYLEKRAHNQVVDSLRGATLVGSIDAHTDYDGVTRSAYLALQLPDGRVVPSGALLLLARLRGVDPVDIVYGDGFVQVGEFRVPTTSDYRVFIRFHSVDEVLRKRDALKPVSYAELFDPQFGPLILDRVAGKVLLFGDYRRQASAYQYSTPTGPMVGLRLQAELLDTLLSGWYLVRFSPAVNFAVLAINCLALAWLLMGIRAVPGLAAWAGFCAWYTALNLWLFSQGYWLDLVGPLWASLAILAVASASQGSRLKRLLGVFVGHEAAERETAIRQEGEAVGGVESVVTVMFTNLPDYLKRLEREETAESPDRRAEYNELATGVYHRWGGRVLDYQGDFQMIVFGAVKHDEDHETVAVGAALELQKTVRTLAEKWRLSEEDHLDVSSGICTGVAAVGYVGSRLHREFAAIGDVSNVAARLLGAARKMGVDILVSEPTVVRAGGRVVAEELEPIPLKGKAKPVSVFRATAILADEGQPW